MVITKIPIFRHAVFKSRVFWRDDLSTVWRLCPVYRQRCVMMTKGHMLGARWEHLVPPWCHIICYMPHMPAWKLDSSADLSDLHALHESTHGRASEWSRGYLWRRHRRWLLLSKRDQDARMVLWLLIPLLFEINDQVDRSQVAFILRHASALEGTQQDRPKVMRQQNRESPSLTGRNLCHVFHNILFLSSSSWSLSPSPSSPRSAAWRRRTTWIFWREWYRKVSSVNLFL